MGALLNPQPTWPSSQFSPWPMRRPFSIFRLARSPTARRAWKMGDGVEAQLEAIPSLRFSVSAKFSAVLKVKPASLGSARLEREVGFGELPADKT